MVGRIHKDDISMEFGLVSDGPECVGVRAPLPLASGWGGRTTDMHTSRTRVWYL